MDKVLLFNGAHSNFANAVFTDLNIAKAWIVKNRLSGMLTLYPVNISIYDWAVNINISNQKMKESYHLNFYKSLLQHLRNIIILKMEMKIKTQLKFT